MEEWQFCGCFLFHLVWFLLKTQLQLAAGWVYGLYVTKLTLKVEKGGYNRHFGACGAVAMCSSKKLIKRRGCGTQRAARTTLFLPLSLR